MSETRAAQAMGGDFTTLRCAFSRPPEILRTRPKFEGMRRGDAVWVMLHGEEWYAAAASFVGTDCTLHAMWRCRGHAGIFHVFVDIAGKVWRVAGERVFEREADAAAEVRTWRRFVAKIPAAAPGMHGAHLTTHWMP